VDTVQGVSNEGYKVSASFQGAAVEDVRGLARDLEHQVTEIRQLMKDVLAAYQQAKWTGPDSEEFARQLNDFNGLMLRRTGAMATACRDLVRVANNQVKASS